MKPLWLNKKINLKDCSEMKHALRALGLNSVCEQAMCPNIGECFSSGTATFLILGKNCTRHCSFCNIRKEAPYPLDENEPERVFEAVRRLLLKHVVITSVTRDDVADGGAGIFAKTVELIRRNLPEVTVEVLIPDFKFSADSLRAVIVSSPRIIAHNLETVPSLYPAVRQGADYRGSLGLLQAVKSADPLIKTKSGLMLGLGEEKEEVISVMRDLREAGCDFLSIGQYLAPSRLHYPVKRYASPAEFEEYRDKALELGFAHTESGPYVRSSYKARDYLQNV